MNNIMRIAFVIGSHRTGTKALANFFKDSFRNVTSYHQYNGMRFTNIFTTMYVEKLLPQKVFDVLVYFILIRRIKRHHSEYYIEVSGLNYIAANNTKKYFPDVKVIHIIRDPRDFVTSFLNWVHGRWKSWIAHNLTPFWNVNGYLVGEMSKTEWNTIDEFERYCWYWKYKNQKILDLYSEDKENFITFRFEDLVSSSDNKKSLEELLTFIGLPFLPGCEEYFRTKQNMSNKQYVPRWRSWNNTQCKQLEKICGQLMKQYNYGIETEWENRLL